MKCARVKIRERPNVTKYEPRFDVKTDKDANLRQCVITQYGFAPRGVGTPCKRLSRPFLCPQIDKVIMTMEKAVYGGKIIFLFKSWCIRYVRLSCKRNNARCSSCAFTGNRSRILPRVIIT